MADGKNVQLSDEIVADGTRVGLFAVAGGWTLQVLEKK